MSTSVRYGIRNVAGDATRFYPDEASAREGFAVFSTNDPYVLVKVTTEVLS